MGDNAASHTTIRAAQRLRFGFVRQVRWKKLNRKRMVALVMGVVLAANARGQGPYPTTAVPGPVYGGYAMPETVPYQPTLAPLPGEPSCNSPVVIVEDPAHGYGPALGPMAPVGPYSTLGVGPYPQSGVPMNAPDLQIPTAGQPTSGRAPWFPGGGRNGVFQKIELQADYLPRFGDQSLGMSDAQFDVVFGLPFFTRETPILITPFYGIHLLDGPNTPDLPPRLHDAAVKFEHFRPLNDDWLLMADLTLGEFADDNSFNSSEAFRITGGGAGVWRPNDRWKWVFGATYVNRANTQILPVAGLIYTPADDREYRLVFPAPRIAWRLPWTDVPGSDERWFYLGGEFGGGAWAVTREDGTGDTLDITDWRLFMGVERKIVGGLSRRLELGYVFSRTLEYESDGHSIDLGDTLMLRGGVTY
jgi:hypothetical protein